MFKHRSSKFLGLLATIALAIVLSACGNSGSGSSDDGKTALGKKEIEIPYIASDNSAPRSLVIAEVLKKAGYDVTTTPVPASGPLYADVSANHSSFHASGIFPDTDKSYYEKYKDKITLYDDKNFIDDVKVGLAVPKYVQDIDSISDLKGNKDFGKSVDWTIQGTDARNGVMKNTKDELDKNDLEDYSLKESSDQEQFKKIQGAFKQQQPIIFTAMEPNWFSKELDVKMLKDPDKIYGSDHEHINLVFNSNFKDQHPAAYKIATRMADDWSQKDEEKLAKKIFVDNKNPEQVAKDYVDNNDNKVDDWLKDVETE
ncbi:ABC transporter substrate-binding protein [Staphylococcus petrasii]|uniref:ABC transporter substrate-binding protein n=1 Tax=Staphylococcus petrasii TaxID=1276936 RepID=A0A380FXD1_9STAP|nr:glycine betaine ABC transporter substrate-binding protein [Staphylococcus petrasii]PNZ30784.1 ABC transporter substrate-binding protein [Staphylococcus petrasii]TGE10846.1 ABC transporter substrate-binding protein [Staphylococcus petrasii]TGE16636.1 ABC transporter substrate-binding protein [Staphylococcus petrasii]SUM42800.1 ABC transporter substrate-binding protein [Staphylococcus petrasii]